MIVKLKELLQGARAALGATAADKHMEALHQAVASGTLDPGQLIVLDFKGITAVNGSYIKGTAFWLFLCGQLAATDPQIAAAPRHIADPRPYDIYGCVTGLTSEVEAEFQEFLRPRRIPLLFARRLGAESIQTASLLGHLDHALKETLKATVDRSKVTAPELHAAFPDEKVTITAWNNRLNDLNAFRLVRRTKVGRAWQYEPLAKEIIWE